MTVDVARETRCCDGGKGVVKSNRYTREEIAAALLSFGEICGNSRGRPRGIKFYRKFYCVPSMPLYGANFLSGGGGQVGESNLIPKFKRNREVMNN